MEINLKQIKRIHFVGMKGVAMAALAIYCKERGMKVGGSDVFEEFPTDRQLKQSGIKVLEGFEVGHLSTKPPPNLVIYTGAHGGKDNVEVGEAMKLGIPVLPHGQALGLCMNGKRQVSIAGSHGKTTTAAMIATVLAVEGCNPSYAVGCGEILGVGPAGHFGRGDFFVAEADEYVTDPGHDPTPRFLWQKPEVLVVTNIDYDHPDAFASLAAVQEAFVSLQRQQTGQKLTVVNIDDQASMPLLAGENVATVGFSPRAQYRLTHVGFGEERTFFSLEQKGMLIGEFSLKVAGRHNALNAAQAAVACYNLGLPWEEIRQGFLAFCGTKRRFEKVGEVGGALIYDDYAHHPQEITATLSAAREWYPQRRLIAVFQPHTYSRTKALLSRFARSFKDADVVILTDIYASAREQDTLGITGATLLEAVAKHHRNVLYGNDCMGVRQLIKKQTKAGDIVLFMGAGDIYRWSYTIVKRDT